MNPYFEQTILNADPVALTAMVYRKAISSVREAREHLRERRIKERSDAIMRAYAALVELLTALRPDASPEIAARLQGLYSYMLERLLEANMKQADAPLEEVLKLLLTLSEAWTEMAASTVRQPENQTAEATPRAAVTDRWSQHAPSFDEGVRLALTA